MIITASLLIICILSVYLVSTRRYDHGIVGASALGVMAIASFIGAIENIYGEMQFNSVALCMYPAMAALLVRRVVVMHTKQRGYKNIFELIDNFFKGHNEKTY